MVKMTPSEKRIFRLSFNIALSLFIAYAIRIDLPYLTPIFALILNVKPGPPIKIKGLIGIVLLVFLTTSIGLLLVTILDNYPFTGILVVAVGLFIANYFSINKKKGAVGSFLTIGLTLITAAGMASFYAAETVAESLIIGICIAIVCQNIVFLFFPEDTNSSAPPPTENSSSQLSTWIAFRATIIVLPAYFMALVNPSLYLSIIMKSVSLGQQETVLASQGVGKEILGSTFLGGFFAIIFWFALGIEVTLWMFFLWMLLFALFFACKLYGYIKTKYPPSFWINVVITMILLLGPAVADSANGKDVYKAFAVRMSLFIAVTLYAWLAFYLTEHIRERVITKKFSSLNIKEA